MATIDEIYARKLAECVARKPGDYAFSAEDVPFVAKKMMLGFRRGSANLHDSRAMRATCRELGIPCTYAGLRSYFASAAGSL